MQCNASARKSVHFPHCSASPLPLQLCYLCCREQPIFSTRAHVFQIDPATKRNWIPASKHALTVSYFYDATRNVYRIISVGGTKVGSICWQHHSLRASLSPTNVCSAVDTFCVTLISFQHGALWRLYCKEWKIKHCLHIWICSVLDIRLCVSEKCAFLSLSLALSSLSMQKRSF